MTQWCKEAVVQFLQGPQMRTPVQNFIDRECLIFDCEEECKLEYTEVFNRFTRLIEDELQRCLAELGIDSDTFMQIVLDSSDDLSTFIFQFLTAADDFVAFRAMMTKSNLLLDQEVLDVYARGGSTIPAHYGAPDAATARTAAAGPLVDAPDDTSPTGKGDGRPSKSRWFTSWRRGDKHSKQSGDGRREGSQGGRATASLVPQSSAAAETARGAARAGGASSDGTQRTSRGGGGEAFQRRELFANDDKIEEILALSRQEYEEQKAVVELLGQEEDAMFAAALKASHEEYLHEQQRKCELEAAMAFRARVLDQVPDVTQSEDKASTSAALSSAQCSTACDPTEHTWTGKAAHAAASRSDGASTSAAARTADRPSPVAPDTQQSVSSQRPATHAAPLRVAPEAAAVLPTPRGQAEDETDVFLPSHPLVAYAASGVEELSIGSNTAHSVPDPAASGAAQKSVRRHTLEAPAFLTGDAGPGAVAGSIRAAGYSSTAKPAKLDPDELKAALLANKAALWTRDKKLQLVNARIDERNRILRATEQPAPRAEGQGTERTSAVEQESRRLLDTWSERLISSFNKR